ncbi:MAG: hypothetical protein Q8L71_13955, partial [Thiobacillus sp.]|nr:hypothetical protein [Thiobacillus sp.]
NAPAPMIVGTTPVKVGHRQTPYPYTSGTCAPWVHKTPSQKEGVFYWVRVKLKINISINTID